MKTYKTIVEYIENLVIYHKQLGANHFYFGKPYNLSFNDIKMPYIVLEYLPFPSTEQTISYKYRLWCMDIIDADKTNYKDVLNDTLLIINDIINYIAYSENEFYVKFNNIVTPFDEKFDDFVAGWWKDIEIKNLKLNDTYSIPKK